MEVNPVVLKQKGKNKPEETKSQSNQSQDDQLGWYKKWRKKWRDMTPANRFMVIFTFVIAFSTSAYAVVSWHMLRALDESNRINQDVLVSVQRPFITSSPRAEIATRIERGKVVSWSPEIPITNNGNTSAKGLFERGNVLVSPEEMPKDFNFHDTGKPEQGVLGPKDSISYETEPIPISAVQSAQHGGHVYVYGWATYRDGFPNTKLHKTEFCYELRLNSIDGDVTNPRYNLPGRFMSCHRHNCTDEGCEEEKQHHNPN